LYALVVLLSGGSRLLAFTGSTLSVLWPADPTRYDIATLGNRQALFLWMAGLLLLVCSVRRRSTVPLVLSALAFTASLLTYEAHVALIAVAGAWMLLRRDTIRQRVVTAAAAWLPLFIFALVSVLSVALAPSNRTYQSQFPLALTPSHVINQLAAGLRVLFLDSWHQPVDL